MADLLRSRLLEAEDLLLKAKPEGRVLDLEQIGLRAAQAFAVARESTRTAGPPDGTFDAFAQSAGWCRFSRERSV
jgi:hypothetical protein